MTSTLIGSYSVRVGILGAPGIAPVVYRSSEELLAGGVR